MNTVPQNTTPPLKSNINRVNGRITYRVTFSGYYIGETLIYASNKVMDGVVYIDGILKSTLYILLGNIIISIIDLNEI